MIFKESDDQLNIASSIRCIVEAMFPQTIYLVRSNKHPELTEDKAIDGLSKVLERIGSIMEKRWREYLWMKYNQILEKYQNFNPNKEFTQKIPEQDVTTNKQEIEDINKFYPGWLEIKADMINKEDETWLN